jgi:hypothetical protein
VFDDEAEGVVDADITLEAPDSSGNFKGRYTDPAIKDTIEGGSCFAEGKKSRIKFTRKHASGATTEYTGKVSTFQGSTLVTIRGRFTRTTKSDPAAATIAEGDWETEKPT